MNSGIKTVDLSRISHSETSIPQSSYEKLLNEIKKVKYPVHAISAAQDLEEKIDSFKSKKVQKELTKSLKGLNSYRQVRGDGNCYFRALAFAYLNSLQSIKLSKCFQFLKQISLTCCYEKSIPKDLKKFYDHKFLKGILEIHWQEIYKRQLKENDGLYPKALLKILNKYPFIDFIIILYFRAICLKAYQHFRSQLQDFFDGSEENTIRKYCEESQGIVLDLCSRMLKIETFVYEIRKDQVSVYAYKNITEVNAKIHLLFYENHYDIIELNAHIDSEKSILKETDESFFEEVNEQLIQGTCFECGNSGSIYEENGLCVKCHEASLSNLQSYKKQKFTKQKCNQCGFTRSQVSQTYGICKDCIQIQKKQQNKPVMVKGKCAQCGMTQPIYADLGLCVDCKKYQARYYQYAKSPPKKDFKKTSKKLIQGRCRKCDFMAQIDDQTKLCSDCATSSSKISHKKKNTCKRCRRQEYVNSEQICDSCLKSPVQMRSQILGQPQRQKRQKAKTTILEEENIACLACGYQIPKDSFLTACPRCKKKIIDSSVTFDSRKCIICSRLANKNKHGMCEMCAGRYCKRCKDRTNFLSVDQLCVRCRRL